MQRARDRRSVCRSRWGASGRSRLVIVAAVAVAAAATFTALSGSAVARPHATSARAHVSRDPRACDRGSAQARPAQSSDCPWLDPSQPIAQRVAEVMSVMTLDQEDFLVEGHGTAKEPPTNYPHGNPRQSVRVLDAGILAELVRVGSRPRRGGRPGRGRRRADRRHPASRRRRRCGHVRSFAGARSTAR